MLYRAELLPRTRAARTLSGCGESVKRRAARHACRSAVSSPGNPWVTFAAPNRPWSRCASRITASSESFAYRCVGGTIVRLLSHDRDAAQILTTRVAVADEVSISEPLRSQATGQFLYPREKADHERRALLWMTVL